MELFTANLPSESQFDELQNDVRFIRLCFVRSLELRIKSQACFYFDFENPLGNSARKHKLTHSSSSAFFFKCFRNC